MPDTPEINNPLPSCCYCSHCNASIIEEGFNAEVSVTGVRYGHGFISESPYDTVMIDNSEEETEEVGEELTTCRNCERNIPSPYTTFRWLGKVSELFSRNSGEYRAEATTETMSGTRKRSIFTTSIQPDPENSERRIVIKHFHKDFIEVVGRLREEEDLELPEFNENHPIYQAMNPSNNQETERTPEAVEEENTIANEDPEDHESVSMGNHQRYGRDIQYTSHAVECPIETCGYTFIVENRNDEHVCPKCTHSWDGGEIPLLTPEQISGMRHVTFTRTN